ncbi:MAG: GxxExxY protein [Chloroflexota bacterium]|nr:GxxExxY protein [Chloroflexota bacterium]
MTFQGKSSQLTEKIIGAFYDVYNELGYGFTEKVYENALTIVLHKRGMHVKQQVLIEVHFHGQIVGKYYADLVINDAVVIELKAVRKLLDEHAAQLLNYLKATKYQTGLLLNFGPKPEIKRKVYDNDRKGSMKWIKTE